MSEKWNSFLLAKGKSFTGSPSRFGVGEIQGNLNFYDYDGTLVYSYTPHEAKKLKSLPPLPLHDNLTGEGWNWTLSEIQSGSYIADVGGIYKTKSGKTELDIEVSPVSGKTVTLNSALAVESWGDGTSADNGQSTHTYESFGEYTLKLNITGALSESVPSSGCIIKRARLGEGLTEIKDAFNSCDCLESVSIHSGLTVTGSFLSGCHSLRFLTVNRKLCNNSYPCPVSGCDSLFCLSMPGISGKFSLKTFENAVSVKRIICGDCSEICADAFKNCHNACYIDLTRNSIVATLVNTSAFSGVNPGFKITVPPLLKSTWSENTGYSGVSSYIVTEAGLISFGSCGTSASYTLSADGTLKLFGSGRLTDFLDNISVPWNSFRDKIKRIEVSGAIPNFSNYSFMNTAIERLIPEADTTSFGYRSMFGCSSLETVVLPGTVSYIGSDAFKNCVKLLRVYFGGSIATFGSGAFSGVNEDFLAFIPYDKTTYFSLMSAVEGQLRGYGDFDAGDILPKNTTDGDYALTWYESEGALRDGGAPVTKAKDTGRYVCEYTPI